MQISIYTDGACDIHADNRPGGWAAILCALDENGQIIRETEIAGGEEHTTNNQMELRAVIEALKKLQKPSIVRIITDSRYIIDIAEGSKLIRKNRALWREYYMVKAGHAVSWEFVAGHSGNPYNERCDKLAVTERKKLASRNVETASAAVPSSDADITVFLASSRSEKFSCAAWAAYLLQEGKAECLGARLTNMTYYEALLIGAIHTLSVLPSEATISVSTVQQNLVKSLYERVPRWIRDNWTTFYNDEKSPVQYKEHWQELIRLTETRAVKFHYDSSLRTNERYKHAQQIAKLMLRSPAASLRT